MRELESSILFDLAGMLMIESEVLELSSKERGFEYRIESGIRMCELEISILSLVSTKSFLYKAGY